MGLVHIGYSDMTPLPAVTENTNVTAHGCLATSLIFSTVLILSVLQFPTQDQGCCKVDLGTWTAAANRRLWLFSCVHQPNAGSFRPALG